MVYTTDQNGKQVIDHNFYESIGLFLSEDGYLEGMNENIYARYLLQKFDLAVRYDYQFYQYRDGYWQRISDRKLKKLLYKHFNHLVDNGWIENLEARSLSALTRICKDSDELIPGRIISI